MHESLKILSADLLEEYVKPFSDGNGRTARLLEKRKPGLEYEELDYAQALPFLQLLYKSLIN